MGWAIDANIVSGARRIARFFVFKGTLYLNAYGYFLYEYAGPGVWNPVLIGGFQTYRGMVWDDLLWASESDNLHHSSDGVAWTLDIDVPLTWGANYREAGYGGNPSGNYLYLANLDIGTGIMHFARRTEAGVWTNNVLTQIAGQIATVRTQMMDSPDGTHVFWTSSVVGTGDRIWDGVSWSAGPLSATYTRYIFFQNHLFACGALSFTDPGNRGGVFRWTGTHWIEEAALGTTSTGHLCVGDNNEMYFGCIDPWSGDAMIYARNGGAWTLVGRDPGAAPIGTKVATWFNDLMFYTENVAANQDVMVYVADYNVSVAGAGAGLCPQSMDVDGDGDALYIGLIDNATTFPILVKAPLPLVNTAMGAEVYTGTAGDAINVECPNIGHSIVIAGNFGAGEQVESSSDGGAVWADVDPTTWGAETAQPVLVDPDTTDQITVGLQNAQVIIETFNANVAPPPPTWTQQSPGAIGYAIAAMARLPVDSDEIIVGDAHAAQKVEYSPNRGVELVDITGGAAIGDVVALEVA